MTMDSDLDSSLSVFTLALLEDTGWYEIYFGMADDMLFGIN